MDAGTRIIGGVSAEFWISGFGAQPDISKADRIKIMINIFRLVFMLSIHCRLIYDHAVRGSSGFLLDIF
jgi:hypothetical protein